jgi:hypothetical protein
LAKCKDLFRKSFAAAVDEITGLKNRTASYAEIVQSVGAAKIEIFMAIEALAVRFATADELFFPTLDKFAPRFKKELLSGHIGVRVIVDARARKTPVPTPTN